MICRQSIALTPNFDIGNGKPLRKLEVGEALEVISEEQKDDKRGMVRCQARSKMDGKEGWVTLKGNQGTAYMEESDRHYTCKAPVSLETRFECGTALVRTLEAGELFEMLEGPRMEVKEGASRLRGRSLTDGSEGWITGPGEVTVPWTPAHRCRQSTPLTESADPASRALRELDVDEAVEALEAPQSERGLMRVRVRCEQDGALGFATVQDR